MKVTRVLGGLAVAAACASAPRGARASDLSLRSPQIVPPLTERLPGPSRPEDPVKAAVFDRVNADRAKAGLSPVAWDEAASRAADALCAAQIAEGTGGHFLTDGVPPYARVGFLGVFGVPWENVVAWRSTVPSFQKSTLDLALSGQAEMMGETAPNDGHRRTILDPDATHVGIGWSQKAGSFRMAQEFLTRRLAELTLELAAPAPPTILVRGRTLGSQSLQFVTIAQEAEPRPLTRNAASARTSYAYPTPHLAYVPQGKKSLKVVGTETLDRLWEDESGAFSFRFTPTRSGLWTLLLYTTDGKAEPRPGGAVVLWMTAGEAAAP